MINRKRNCQKMDTYDKNNLRITLVNFINKSCISKKNILFYIILPRFIINRNAKKISEDFNEKISSESLFTNLDISISIYDGQNYHVKKMMNYLESELSNDLFGAYVIGSLATGEEIKFSDFDALVVIKNEVIEDYKRLVSVANKLQKAQKIMFKMDPLQHHGWFVLAEDDLVNYPADYFPVELLSYGRSLLKENGLQLRVSFSPDNLDFTTPFLDLAESIKLKIDQNYRPKNMFELKGFLSQFMLLPSLYCQARDNKGIFKKYSFQSAKADFSVSDWSIMDEVSEIRQNWQYNLNLFQRILLKSKNPILLKLKKNLNVNIPIKIQKKLTRKFFLYAQNLISKMEKNIK